MTRQEQLSCLTDRPCAVCKHHTDNGCSQWKCVFEEQPFEDAISRQAAIDAMCDASIPIVYKGDPSFVVDYVGVIAELPSVSTEKTGRWIPISERLPEVNQRVLVTSYGRVCYAMMTSVDGNSGYPIFRLQDSLNERVICETTVHSEFTTSRITAWMPLPKPYEPQKSEGKR